MKKILSKEFITYCLVGLINTLVGTSTAFICLNVFLLSYSVATSFSFLIGNVVAFFLNKKFTFKNKDKSFSQFLKFFFTLLPAYVVSYWAGFQISGLCFKYLAEIFNPIAEFISHYSSIPFDKIDDNFAIIISMAIYLIVGFSINKFIVFKNEKEPEK